MTASSLTAIKSSMASHAAYDPKAQTLSVRFHNGTQKTYKAVPHNIGETVINAASFGRAFNKHIAGKYST